MLKLYYFGHLMQRTDSFKKTLMMGTTEGRRRRGWRRVRWLVDITNSMDMSLSKLQEMVMDRQGWRAAVHEVPKSWSWMSNWTDWNKGETEVSVFPEPLCYDTATPVFLTWVGLEICPEHEVQEDSMATIQRFSYKVNKWQKIYPGWWDHLLLFSRWVVSDSLRPRGL